MVPLPRFPFFFSFLDYHNEYETYTSNFISNLSLWLCIPLMTYPEPFTWKLILIVSLATTESCNHS